MNKLFCRVVVLMVCIGVLPQQAMAQAIAPEQLLNFGQLMVPGTGGIVQIEATGSVSIGESWTIPNTGLDNAIFRITGAPGTIDIAISGAAGCSGNVQFSNFTANWNGTIYADISTTPISGVAFDGDQRLYVGGRITYSSATSLGPCPSNYDLTILYN